MAATKVDQLLHIAPIEVRKNVTTSPHPLSETRHITAIPINFMDIGMQQNGGIILWNTPGFLDTSGPVQGNYTKNWRVFYSPS
ncbi:unnamed protein product [Didymodactylos carnosus]|uniref:Uncharacterized protein n=2 Tax=Didymodactylos carnosus TaxID=1234261 RepID=A0A813ZU95_9BILA|nr:unnamed protein product [Didymodactylos carnosus]CAF3684942.1 unnamed protein product [Didymodactylos carnosus]